MIGLTFDTDCIIAASLTDGGDFLSRESIPCPQTDRRDWLLAVSEVIAKLKSADGPVGVAAPAIILDGKVEFTSQSFLADADLRRDLQSALGRQVMITDIGTALGIGAGPRLNRSGMVITIWIGQQCHGGVFADGRPISGAHGAAGNWPHLQLPSPVPHELEGRPCWCGRTGCLDVFLSTVGLELDYERLTNEAKTAAEIASAAVAGDIVSESVIQVFEDRLGRATATLISIMDPEQIIIGGTLPHLDRFKDRIPRKWPGYVQVDRRNTQLDILDNGLETVLKGAAMLTSPIPTS